MISGPPAKLTKTGLSTVSKGQKSASQPALPCIYFSVTLNLPGTGIENFGLETLSVLR